MNLDQLANLGEFVGGVAVLVTLIYLATQTRQTRVAAEEAARFAAVNGTFLGAANWGQWRAMFLHDPEVSELIAKANRGEELTDAEQIRRSVVCEQLFVNAYVGFVSSSSDASMHVSSFDVDYVTDFLGRNPSGREDWERWKGSMEVTHPEFVAAVDRGLPAERP